MQITDNTTGALQPPSNRELSRMINGSIRFAVRLIGLRFWLFFSLTALSALCGIALFILIALILKSILRITGIDFDAHEHVSDIVAVLSALISLSVISAGTKQVVLKLYDAKDTKWSDFFHKIKHFHGYALTTALYYACSAAAIGLLILVANLVHHTFPSIPIKYLLAAGSIIGPVVFVPLRFAGALTLDRGLPFAEAIRGSMVMTKGIRIHIFLLYAGLSTLLFGPLSGLIHTLAQVDGILAHIVLQSAIVLLSGMLLFTLLLLPEMYLYRALLYRVLTYSHHPQDSR